MGYARPRSAMLTFYERLQNEYDDNGINCKCGAINPCYDVTSDPVAEGSFIYSTSTVFTYKNFHSSVFRLFMGNKHKGFVIDVPQFHVCEMFTSFFTGFLWELLTSSYYKEDWDVFCHYSRVFIWHHIKNILYFILVIRQSSE